MRMAWAHGFRGLIFAGATTLLAACGSDGSDSLPPAPPPPAATSAVIGAAGGTLTGPDGVQLIVPAGALSADTTLRIARSSAGAPALPDELRPDVPVYEVTPHDLAFLRPVQLRLPLRAAPQPDAAVLVASPTEPWASGEVTFDGNTAIIERSRLSWYSPLDGYALACAPRSGDPYPCILPVVTPGAITTTPAGVISPPASITDVPTINSAATLNFNIGYGAPRDCANARLRVFRVGPGAPTAAAPRGTVLLDEAVPMNPTVGSNTRSGGRRLFQTPVDSTLNGFVSYEIAFSCTRAFGNRGIGSFTRGSYRVNVPAVAAPVISTPPANAVVVEPATATFSVVAAGTALSYQWERNVAGTWTNISGATGASYTTGATTRASDDGAQFRVTISNSAGTVTSNPVTLTVNSSAANVPWQADQVISGGGTHTLVVRSNGELWSWGVNNGGALGRADANTVTAPSPVTTLGSTVRSVAAGAWYSVALRTDGTVWAWGDGARVGAAVGSAGAIQLPLQVSGLSNIRAISTRYQHTLALRDDGTVWGFGPETFSALGASIGNGSARQITGLTDVRQVAAGEQHSLALLADGTVRTWGSNSFGQLGVSGTSPSTAPQSVPITNVVSIAASSFASFALRSDGTVWRWGNFAGTSNTSPVQVVVNVTGPVGTISALAAGNATLHALRSDGTVLSAGDNLSGRVGIGTVGGTVATLRELGGFSGTVNAIGGGEFHGMAIRSDGQVFTWGNNSNRQLRGTAGADVGSPQDTGFRR